MKKRDPAVIKWIGVCTIFFMWLYSNFQENVMTVMLTHGWPLCYVPGFESPRNRFWLNGIMSQTVPLWTGTKKKKKKGVRFGLQNLASCAHSSVAVRITPPRFSSPLCTDAVAAAALLYSYQFPIAATTNRTLGSSHRDSGIIATKGFGTGIFKRSFHSTDLQRHTTLLERETQGFSFLKFPRAN